MSTAVTELKILSQRRTTRFYFFRDPQDLSLDENKHLSLSLSEALSFLLWIIEKVAYTSKELADPKESIGSLWRML